MQDSEHLEGDQNSIAHLLVWVQQFRRHMGFEQGDEGLDSFQ